MCRFNFFQCTTALALLVCGSSQASEEANLALILRQLDNTEIIAQRNSQQTDVHSRYIFNYPRFSTDLEHIRSGIRDYLAPPRAQPRDPFEIKGDYRLENPDGDAQ